jgi:hypothetical protein
MVKDIALCIILEYCRDIYIWGIWRNGLVPEEDNLAKTVRVIFHAVPSKKVSVLLPTMIRNNPDG